MNKRAFSLVEMLIVLSIMGIILLLMRPIFQNNNQSDPKDCLQSLYQQTNNFIFDAANPQSIESGIQRITPDTYTVAIQSGRIEYLKKHSGEVVSYDNRVLNTHTDICSIPYTDFMLSGSVTQFSIHNQTMNISAPVTAFTGAIQLWTCQTNTGCNYIGQMIIDTRTQRLYISS